VSVVAELTTEPETAETAVMTPLGWVVPLPVVKAVASRRSLASARSGPTSAPNPESARTSKEPCTQAAAFFGVMDGCANAGEASAAWLASASHSAVTPADETPFHVSVVIVLMVDT
jgi:hypothetical protein